MTDSTSGWTFGSPFERPQDESPRGDVPKHESPRYDLPSGDSIHEDTPPTAPGPPVHVAGWPAWPAPPTPPSAHTPPVAGGGTLPPWPPLPPIAPPSEPPRVECDGAGAGGFWPLPPAPAPSTPRRTGKRAALWVALALAVVMIAGLAGLVGATALRRGVALPPLTAGQPVPATPANPANPATPASPSTDSATSGSGSTPTGAYPGVVEISTVLADSDGATAGTGMLLDDEGHILTNNHVIEGADTIKVQIGGIGKTYTAEVLGYDASHDVAVLDIDLSGDQTPIAIGDSSRVRIGDDVTAVGNALGRAGPPTAVEGQVTNLGQTVTASDGTGSSETLYGMIQTDARIQPGDSGGPLFDADGKVIGMVTAGEARSRRSLVATTGFAIPIDDALAIARKIEAGQSSSTIHIGERGILGVQLQQTSTRAGVVVVDVQDDSPARSAGMEAGDVLTLVAGKKITTSADVAAALNPHQPGDKVTVGWTDSSGKTHSANIRLAEGPPA